MNWADTWCPGAAGAAVDKLSVALGAVQRCRLINISKTNEGQTIKQTEIKTAEPGFNKTNSPNVTSVKRLLLQYKRDIIKWTLEKHCGEINNEERGKTPQRSDIITQSSTDWSVGVQSTLTSDLISNQRLLCLLRTQGVIILSTSRTWGSAPVTAGKTFNTAAPPTSDICPGFKSVLRHGPSGQNSCSTVHVWHS